MSDEAAKITISLPDEAVTAGPVAIDGVTCGEIVGFAGGAVGPVAGASEDFVGTSVGLAGRMAFAAIAVGIAVSARGAAVIAPTAGATLVAGEDVAEGGVTAPGAHPAIVVIPKTMIAVRMRLE